MDIGQSFQGAVDGFIGFLPNLLAFIVILIVGYIIAKIIAAIISKALDKLGLDRKLRESDQHNYVDKILPGASPSGGISKVVFWLIFVFFIFAAIGALKIPAVTTFMNDVLAYLPNVIAAMLIFVIASILAGAIAAAVTNFMGDTPTGKVAATVLPAIVMVIAMFMILQQLKIAEEIVQIAFAAIMGALALGLALAFGLGGRNVAERMLEDAYRKGQEQKGQIKQDLDTGRSRAEDSAAQQRDRLDRGEHQSDVDSTRTDGGLSPVSGRESTYGTDSAGTYGTDSAGTYGTDPASSTGFDDPNRPGAL